MYTLESFLPEHEARAERAYLEGYRTEYARLSEPGQAADRERLLYWSELAHRAGKAARETELGRVPTHSSSGIIAGRGWSMDVLRQELGGQP